MRRRLTLWAPPCRRALAAVGRVAGYMATELRAEIRAWQRRRANRHVAWSSREASRGESYRRESPYVEDYAPVLLAELDEDDDRDAPTGWWNVGDAVLADAWEEVRELEAPRLMLGEVDDSEKDDL